jgi:hypothetical protein
MLIGSQPRSLSHSMTKAVERESHETLVQENPTIRPVSKQKIYVINNSSLLEMV